MQRSQKHDVVDNALLNSGHTFSLELVERVPAIYRVVIDDLYVWLVTKFNDMPVHAIAFEHGSVFCAHAASIRMLSRDYRQTDTISTLVARMPRATHLFVRTAEFDQELFEHFGAVTRGLSCGYDVVQESYNYVEILQHISEQLAVVCDNHWDSVDDMRDALRSLTGFITERFINLTSVPWQERRQETLNSLMTCILQQKFGHKK